MAHAEELPPLRKTSATRPEATEADEEGGGEEESGVTATTGENLSTSR